MAGFLQRGILLYLFVAIAVSMAVPQVIFDNGSPAGNSVMSWFDLDSSYTGTTPIVTNTSDYFGTGVTSDAQSSLSSQTSPSQSGGILGWLDPLFQVFSWVPMIFRVIFSPIILLTDSRVAMPGIVILIFAIPLVLLFIIGLIAWIRSGII